MAVTVEDARANQRAQLEALLDARLEQAQQPEYEGQILSVGQQWLLATAGLIIPVILLIIGWVIK